MVELDLKSGKSTQFHPSDPFFVGFLTVFQTDLQEVKGTALEIECPFNRLYLGLAGTVTENGYCKDACIGVGTLQFPRGGETGKFNWIHVSPRHSYPASFLRLSVFHCKDPSLQSCHG